MTLASRLHWRIEAAPERLMKRLREGRYEGICKNGKRVRIDAHDGGWELYLGNEFIGKYPLKRVALRKANLLLESEECDEQKD